MKLQHKLTLALMAMSLTAIATVGGMSYWLIMRGFEQTAMEDAFRNFQGDITAYLDTYGTWERAVASERFSDFHRRRNSQGPEPMREGGPGEGGFDRPPPPPPGMEDRRGPPPFRFLVMDTEGRVLRGANGLEPGTAPPDDWRKKAVPIYHEGKIALLASPMGEPNLTKRDQAYLSALRNALIAGAVAALSLSVLIGFLMGRRLSRRIGVLTAATRSMLENKEFPNPVEVRGNDEVSELKRTFNQMNAELVRSHCELRELSARDPLTGLFNRRHFDAQANIAYQQALRYGRPLTVMVGDLDHFKQINDRFSHAVGDQVLCAVAEILMSATRKSDVVARFGGEEFVVLFLETALPQAAHCCEELRRQIEDQPWEALQPGLRVTMSMGLCDTLSIKGVDAMLAEADSQLYAAKNAGRNCVMPRLD